MITKKNIKIPIFNRAFRIVIVDDWKEISDWEIMKNVPKSNGREALTFSFDEDGMIEAIFKSSTSEGVVAHEAEHIKDFTWEQIGHEPQKGEFEISAYYIQYLVDLILNVMDKHKQKSLI